MNWVRLFRQCDLYSKPKSPPDTVALKLYGTNLIGRFFPETIEWGVYLVSVSGVFAG